MFDIILSNYGVWFNLLIPLVIGGYLLMTHKEMVLKEFGIQVGLTVVFVFGIYTLMFSVTTDLVDDEQWNGVVTKAKYYEGYEYEYDCSYESCTGSGENETCVTIPQTCESWKSPDWIGYSTVGQFYISKSQYRKYSNRFGHTEQDIYHGDQTTSSRLKGEGDEWTSIVNDLFPVSLTKSYENLVVAANANVLNVKASEADIKMLKKEGKLKEYPTKYKNSFGIPKQHRVIDTTGTINVSDWESKLDIVASKIGHTRQANPIIYITDEGQDFKYILEAYWKGAKKNDIILILGVSGGEVVWSDAIAWTNNTDFFVEIQNVPDFEIQSGMITGAILMSKVNQFYIRKPMKEFDYLKENITLDWTWQLLIFIMNLGLSGMFLYISLTNRISKRSRY